MIATIREATPADLEAILDLYVQALEDPQVLALDEARRLLEEFHRYPNYRLFVACAPGEGAVIGSYALLVMHNLAHGGAPSAVVEDLAVSPRSQSQGVGRQMMAHAMERAHEAGCYKLALSSNARRTQAHAFYESLGFRRHGYSFVIET